MRDPDERSLQFAKQMRAGRERLGITQAQMADVVGLTRTSITNVEAGRQPVSLATAHLIAVTLQTTLDAMVGDWIEL